MDRVFEPCWRIDIILDWHVIVLIPINISNLPIIKIVRRDYACFGLIYRENIVTLWHCHDLVTHWLGCFEFFSTERRLYFAIFVLLNLFLEVFIVHKIVILGLFRIVWHIWVNIRPLQDVALVGGLSLVLKVWARAIRFVFILNYILSLFHSVE